jgi:hypothetical protein
VAAFGRQSDTIANTVATGRGRDFVTVEKDAPRRFRETENSFHRGGFPGPVGPHKCHDLARPDLQGNIANSSHGPVIHGQSIKPEHS